MRLFTNKSFTPVLLRKEFNVKRLYCKEDGHISSQSDLPTALASRRGKFRPNTMDQQRGQHE